ncbi:Ig-like domain-containing protein [Cystobacter fuscus]|uniref:Ig-like domain-containing protein n=1 Tax=Cystobacter fuscus TaxID=43 RepID=UPI002B29931E|nr:OmpA family protein [Cystobacter fuscus]
MRNPSLPSPTPPRALAWGERASALVLAVALSLVAGSTQAQPKHNDPPKLRFAQDLRGDFALIGNTLAQDCRPGVTPRPLSGRMPPMGSGLPGDAACSRRDTSPDFFWTLNDWTVESTGAATQPAAPITSTTVGITPTNARSQAALSLPAGAQVVYARLYWAATRFNTNSGDKRQEADLTARLSRPGVAGFDKALFADDYAFYYPPAGTSEYHYQSTADITDIVRQYGAGRYQVSDVQAINLDTLAGGGEFIFDGWWMAVFYEVPGSTKRHLKLFDSMRVVTGNNATNFTLNGFYVPSYATDAKLGVIAFEGDEPDNDNGDTFSFNGKILSNDLNPADNFFNSTRSWTTKGGKTTTDTPLSLANPGTDGVFDAYPISHRNDRPQLTGTPNSMSGMDLDVVDVTLASGDRTATAAAATKGGGDTFWLAGFITSITTQAPDFVNTIKSVKNLTRADGTVRPGDVIEYTISTENIGDDISRDTVVNDKLPTDKLDYVPGSLKLLTVAASDTQTPGALTDAKGDDVGHYDATTGTVTVYLGKGATPTKGGQLKGVLVPGDLPERTSISFQMKVKATASNGRVENQAIITAGGVLGIEPVNTPSRNPDGQGPTDIEIAIVPKPVIQTPAEGSIVPTARPTYTGTALPGTTVTVYENGIALCTATTTASGTWSCVSTSLGEGGHKVTAVATNSEGTSEPTLPRSFSVDTQKPAAPTITVPTANAVLTTQRPTFEGTAEANSTVIVSVDGQVIGRTTADSSGKWWLPSILLADGPHTVSATSQDAAGNRSDATSVPFTIDAKPPETVIDTGPASNSTTGTANFTFTGTSATSGIHSFDCSLNGSPFIKCADANTRKGAYAYTNLPEGRYTFRVRARTQAGAVDLTPAVWTWVVGLDTDKDGIPDSIEDKNHNGTVDPGETDPNNPDTDGDGIKDGLEDANGNGTLDPGETDPLNTDSDADGLPDGVEDANHNGTRDPTETDPRLPDTDGGGVPDGLEDRNHNGTVDPGETDPRDPKDDDTRDSDGDGILDVIEQATGTNPNNPDTDGDGISDGVEDKNHNGSVDPGETDPRKADSDADGLPDGIEDKNHNGTRDPGETDPLNPDSDTDGLPDGIEDKNHNGTRDPGETDPLNPDTDGGGVRDGAEDKNHDGIHDPDETDPLNPADDDPTRDSDQDGITDNVEAATGTDPNNPDTDGDGIPDGVEDKNHNGSVDPGETDPRKADTDGGGTPDGVEDKNHNGTRDPGETDPLDPTDDDPLRDSDQDGIPDDIENTTGTDPNNPDTDGDGLLDGVEDKNHNGSVDPGETDPRKADTDGGGVSDGDEDKNHNGTVDPGETDPLNPADDKDADGDGIPNDVETNNGTDPNNADTDGDGLSDGEEDANHNGTVDDGETDPRKADTDGGGTSDGEEVKAHTNPLDGNDDLLLGGRGCSTSGGSPLAWLTMALLGLPWLRSRRAPRPGMLGGLLGLAGVLSAPAADAQVVSPSPLSQSIDVQRYKPGPGATDILGVHGSRVDNHLGWHLGASVNYASNPLGFYNPATDRFVYELVAHQATLDVMGSLSLWNRFELGVVLPITYQASESEAGFTPSFAQGVAGAGLGDVRLVPKLNLVSSENFGLGLVVPVLLPSAGGEAFRGGAGVSARPQLVVEWGRDRGARLVANLGANIQREEQLRNLRTGTELMYALGAQIPFSEKLALRANLAGSYGLNYTGFGALPLEVLAALQYRFSPGLSAHLGGGPGLTRGYGTPAFRVFAGIDWHQPGERASTAPKAAPTEEATPAAPAAPAAAPVDTDGDGIPDTADKCPTKAEDKDGFEDQDGCPDRDNDKDGRPDVTDRCPNEPETINGFQDEDGCPDASTKDSDGDGLLDSKDKCPLQAEDKDGFQDEDGCPDPDNDQDGVPDTKDQCPNEPEVINGVKDEDGCPDEGKSKVRLESNRIVILDKVYFATAKDVILPKSFSLLKQVASVLKANPQIELLRVEGHTDNQGNDASNLRLSQRRADKVRAFLIREGIAGERLDAMGFGETRPVDDNKKAAGRENNRRVEFNILKMSGQDVQKNP